ncbi:MAG: zinc ribbon domain-containing protein [Terriglobia bacterium]
MNANATVTESSEYLPSQQREAASTGCKRCGTDLKLGAEFCHVCGRWVFGSNLSRLMKGTRAALSQTGIELPVLVCMVTAAVFAVISMFVGIRIEPKTIGEWQVIQYWRIEWLLGAIVMLLFGVLLKKSS